MKYVQISIKEPVSFLNEILSKLLTEKVPHTDSRQLGIVRAIFITRNRVGFFLTNHTTIHFEGIYAIVKNQLTPHDFTLE